MPLQSSAELQAQLPTAQWLWGSGTPGSLFPSHAVPRASQPGTASPGTARWHPQLCWEGQGEGCAPGRAVSVISWHRGRPSVVAWEEAEALVSLRGRSAVVAQSSAPQRAEMPKQNVFK